MRSAKEEKYFPYGLKLICYFAVYPDGKIEQIPNTKTAAKSVYEHVKAQDFILYAVWPGQWRSDLFIIDDIELYAEAYGVKS